MNDRRVKVLSNYLCKGDFNPLTDIGNLTEIENGKP